MELELPHSLGELLATISAAIIALVIGNLIKYYNKISENSKNELETHLVLRKELREELDAVKEELYRLQSDLDEWKEKYYNQVEITGDLKIAILKLNEDLADHKKIHEELLVKYQEK